VKVTTLAHGIYRVDAGTQVWTVAVAGPPENRWVWVDGRIFKLAPPATPRSRGRTTHDDLSAPMPATVVKLMVTVGQSVARGDTVVMLEAMKMELPIRAPRDGVVRVIDCRVGELVQPGRQLLTIEGAEQRDGAEGQRKT
jgi:biotin carboxyl carrier protein